MIVLRNTLSYITSRGPNNWVGAGVIVILTPKDLDPDCSLLELAGIALKFVLYGVAQKCRAAFAVLESRVGKKPLKLRRNCVFISL